MDHLADSRWSHQPLVILADYLLLNFRRFPFLGSQIENTRIAVRQHRIPLPLPPSVGAGQTTKTRLSPSPRLKRNSAHFAAEPPRGPCKTSTVAGTETTPGNLRRKQLHRSFTLPTPYQCSRAKHRNRGASTRAVLCRTLSTRVGKINSTRHARTLLWWSSSSPSTRDRTESAFAGCLQCQRCHYRRATLTARDTEASTAGLTRT